MVPVTHASNRANGAVPSAEGPITRIAQNISWGIRGASPFVLAFSLWVLFLAVVQASASIRLGKDDRVNAFAVIACYVVGGAFVGIIVGLLRPLLRWRLGAMLVGWVSAIPVFFTLTFMFDGAIHWQATLREAMVWGLLLGLPSGLVLYGIFTKSPKEPTPG